MNEIYNARLIVTEWGARLEVEHTGFSPFLALTDEDYTVNEIKERVGAVEIMCRPYRVDTVDPVWEHMWKIDDVTIWVTVAGNHVVGVRTGNIRG